MSGKLRKNLKKISTGSPSDWEIVGEGKDEFCSVERLANVKLEKSFDSTSKLNSKFFVLKSESEGKIPDLNFVPDYFDGSTETNKEFHSSEDSFVSIESDSKICNATPVDENVKKDLNESLSAKSKVRILPSDTLLASAALLKSYFTISSDRDLSGREGQSYESEDSVKNVVKGMWHNVKYGWSANLKTNFSKEIPIYLLGKFYHRKLTGDNVMRNTELADIESFKRDFNSIIWFTYRHKFSPLPLSDLTSDCGWGCMIRSGQMLMAVALRRHLLPKEWVYNVLDHYSSFAKTHRQIIQWFSDEPSILCPFSLHALVMFGHKMDKFAGSWYGPSCVSYMLKEAMDEAAKEYSALNNLCVYVAQDGAVYMDDVANLCNTNHCTCIIQGNNSVGGNGGITSLITNGLNVDSNSQYKNINKDKVLSENNSQSKLPENFDYSFLCDDEFSLVNGDKNDMYGISNCDPHKYQNLDSNRTLTSAVSSKNSELNNGLIDNGDTLSSCAVCEGWKSCVILIPVRLGGSALNPIYNECVHSLFMYDLCIGIIGGRPKHSLYFVGCQDDSLIYLDPHFNQEFVPLIGPQAGQSTIPPILSSFHCSSPRKMLLSKMDPSATVGFYCHSRKQFDRLVRELPMIITAKDGNMESPMFEFLEGKCQDVRGELEHGEIIEEDFNPSSSPQDVYFVQEADVM